MPFMPSGKRETGRCEDHFWFKILTWDFIGVRNFFVELFKKKINNNNKVLARPFFFGGGGGLIKVISTYS